MRQINLPTRLTILRLLAVPLVLILLVDGGAVQSFLAAIVFIFAAATDWLDGHLARSTDSITPLGKLLDPMADKLLILAALIPLVALGHVPAWLATIMIGREFAVTGLRMVAASGGVIMAAGNMGKWKTGFELAAMVQLILQWNLGLFHFQTTGMICLLVALFFSLSAAYGYFAQYISSITREEAVITPTPDLLPSEEDKEQ